MLKAIILFLLILSAFAEVFEIGDLEGSFERIDALVREGQMRWEVKEDGSRVLRFTNANDRLVFVGDLSGVNADTPRGQPLNPRNIELREAFLELADHYNTDSREPRRVSWILGNHEYNRFAFVRENIRIDRGENPEFRQWLRDAHARGWIESVDEANPVNRVQFWANQFYGDGGEDDFIARDGKNPLVHYQAELTNRMIANGTLEAGQTVSMDEAARQFMSDLEVGRNGRPNGRMLQYLLQGREIIFDGGFRTHGPPSPTSIRVIPESDYRPVNGVDWVHQRYERYFKPALAEFMAAAQRGEVPRSIIFSLGDARADSISGIVADGRSTVYTVQPRELIDDIGYVPMTISDEDMRFLCATLPPQHCNATSGHKPVGDTPAVLRQEFTDERGQRRTMIFRGVDTSRSGAGLYSTTAFDPDTGNVNIRGTARDAAGNEYRYNYYTGPETNPQIGQLTEDGFTVRGYDQRGNWIVERMGFYNRDDQGNILRNADGELDYNEYRTETRVIPPDELGAIRLPNSNFDNDVSVNSLQRQLVETIEGNSNSSILNSSDEIAEYINGRYIIDFSGDADFATPLTDAQRAQVRANLERLARELDPTQVVILKRGNNIVRGSDAIEDMVSEIFSRPGRNFDILGVIAADTPSGEIDPNVNRFILTRASRNFEGMYDASRRILLNNRGISVTIGGQGEVLKSGQSLPGRDLAYQGRSLIISDVPGASSNPNMPGTSMTLSSFADGVLNHFRLDQAAAATVDNSFLGRVVGVATSPTTVDATTNITYSGDIDSTPISTGTGAQSTPERIPTNTTVRFDFGGGSVSAEIRCDIRALEQLIRVVD